MDTAGAGRSQARAAVLCVISVLAENPLLADIDPERTSREMQYELEFWICSLMEISNYVY